MLTLLLAGAVAAPVSLSITTRLAVAPNEAKSAWLEYAWARGGGLPLVRTVLNGDDDRTLLPLLLRERILEDADDRISYIVTDPGPVLGVDIVEASHTAQVSFSPSGDDGTDMTWAVEFDARARGALWEAVTRSTVGEVSANLEARLRPPAVFTLTARLAGASSPSEALDAWLQCLADGDLGVPMPPPIVLAPGDEATRVGYERLILPPGLRERVIDIQRGDDGAPARCEYTVVNPSWLTCYPVHTHRGEVVLSPAEGGGGGVLMTWRVFVRPLRGGAPVVRALTSLIVPAFARTLASRLDADADADVRSSWSY